MRRPPRLLVVGVLLLVGTACAPANSSPPATTVTPGAATQPTAAPAASATPRAASGVVVVEAAEQYFNPDQLTVSAGTTVVWNDVQGTHDMVADDKSFASAVLFEGGSYAHQFTTPGRYRYICTLHVGAGMWAEVDVQ